MKRVLCTLCIYLLAGSMAIAGAKKHDDEIQRKSFDSSYPQPFMGDQDWPRANPAISTGYYIVDSEDAIGKPWTPSPADLFVDTNFQRGTWHRIVSGPSQFPPDYWQTFREGHMYFRNPGDLRDSTDNAFAGPIRIGFPFYFNGVRYDSFYVSTNMLIALSNRRYFYDSETNMRTVPDGRGTAWDVNSDDARERLDESDAANGLGDETADDWGYRFVACGGDPSDPELGIRRPDNTSLANFSNDAPIIAPAWDDWQLSQFNDQLNQEEDYGQVWFKRDVANSKLTIYYVRVQPMGGKRNPINPGQILPFKVNNRVGVDRLAYELNAQITLDRSDSTISFLYSLFQPPLVVPNNVPIAPGQFVRFNSTIGVRGQARYVDDEFVEQRYTQYSEYLRDGTVMVAGPPGSENTAPANDLAIRFKQYKNTLRVVDIKYLVRDPNDAKFSIEVNDPANYELLIGDRLLGSLQPVVLIQNLSNDVQGPQGVNFQKQGLSFRARFKILNDILDDEVVYSRQVCVDSFALANPNSSGVRMVNYDRESLPFESNGLPPYAFVEIRFPGFDSNPFIAKQIGRLTSMVIAEPFLCRGRGGYGDEWPFDDTTRVRLFGIKVLQNFSDHVGDFSFSRREGTLPSVNKWVSIGAEAVDGNANTYNPPPPRGEFHSANNVNVTLNSPVIRMNRIDIDGTDFSPFGQAPAGDELRSFPIDLRGHHSAILSFSYQRSGRPQIGDWPRGWSDQMLTGPEPRVMREGDATSTALLPDELEVHFKNPTPDNYQNITNVPDRGWSRHPRLDDPDKFVVDNPAWTVFGGGGHNRGFHEDNLDSALPIALGLRADLFDDGKDWEFNKVFVPVPDYLLSTPNEGERTFRFKLTVKARTNTRPPDPQDDFDPFYVDNVRILFPTETPDLEAALVGVVWPYTMVPASQAQKIPVQVKLANNSTIPSRAFAVRVTIRERSEPSDTLLVYCRTRTIPFLRAQRESRVNFPTWNGRETRPGQYILRAALVIPGGDPEPSNDSTEGDFNLRFGNAFAYDPPSVTGVNDVPDFTPAIAKGLNLSGFNSGGAGGPIPFGADAGNSSGQIAMKFNVTTRDTLLGYQALFGSLNSDVLNITFSVYEDGGGTPSSLVVRNSRIRKRRGQYDIDAFGNKATPASEPIFDEYATYVLPRELVLEPGTYWMGCAQMGTEGFELGASRARMGMVTTNFATIPTLGVSGTSLLIDKNLRVFNSAGESINGSWFAYENTFRSGTWGQFTPTVGNPAYAHLTHAGQYFNYASMTRGSWIPLLRPYFGDRTFANPPQYTGCYFVPVELSAFDGEVLPPLGIELFWETASEENNAGFYVERRLAESGDDFDALGFVKGAGNSTARLHYEFLDEEVSRGATYEYRLRQVDYDGTVDYSRSVTLRYNFADELRLSNSPNPFTESTQIVFSVPVRSKVKLEIIDMLGNTLRTLLDEEMKPSTENRIEWDARDNGGRMLASGAYICRLTIGERTVIRSLNIIN